MDIFDSFQWLSGFAAGSDWSSTDQPILVIPCKTNLKVNLYQYTNLARPRGCRGLIERKGIIKPLALTTDNEQCYGRKSIIKLTPWEVWNRVASFHAIKSPFLFYFIFFFWDPEDTSSRDVRITKVFLKICSINIGNIKSLNLCYLYEINLCRINEIIAFHISKP